MYDMNKLLERWQNESRIDNTSLDEASIESAKLHSKYLEYYYNAKQYQSGLELKYKTLVKNKWLWYNGKMEKEEMDKLGWSYDPLNRLKVMKGDMNYFYDADEDLQKMSAKLDQAKLQVETLKEILENIKWRHQSIRNAIEWRRFESGI